jgi:hypothetical protein
MALYLRPVLLRHAGQRVLIYGHKSIRDEVMKWLQERQSEFNLAEVAYEWWWSGRGKDSYKHFDAVVTLTEPIQNIGAIAHSANARAFRDAAAGRSSVREKDLRQATLPKPTKRGGRFSLSGRDIHQRIRLEHERQNVSELAQAAHRVRGLMSPKSIYFLGHSVELSRDMLAASVTVRPGEQPSPTADRGAISEGLLDDWVSVSELASAISAVIDWYGLWSPAWSHALYSVNRLGAGESASKIGSGKCLRIIIDSRQLPEPLSDRGPLSDCAPTCPPGACQAGSLPGSLPGCPPGACQAGSLPGCPPGACQAGSLPGCPPGADRGSCLPADGWAEGQGSLPLVRRVWEPPLDWRTLNDALLGVGAAGKVAQAMKLATRDLPWGGRLQPVWASSQVRYEWRGRLDPIRGDRVFREIMDRQYGPSRDGALHTPNRLPWVPF